MAHELKVDMKNAIRTLLEKGVSHRQTASMLRIDRKTVDRYAGLLRIQNGPQVPAGCIEQNGHVWRQISPQRSARCYP